MERVRRISDELLSPFSAKKEARVLTLNQCIEDILALKTDYRAKDGYANFQKKIVKKIPEFVLLYESDHEENQAAACGKLWDHFYLIHFLVILWEVSSELNKTEVALKVFGLFAKLSHEQCQHDKSLMKKGFALKVKYSRLPDDLKKMFPHDISQSEKNSYEMFVEKNVDLPIPLKDVLKRGMTKTTISLLGYYLDQMKSEVLALPLDPDFSKHVYAEFGDSKKITQKLNKLHKSHPDWSAGQTLYKKAKKRKKEAEGINVNFQEL